MYIHVVQIKCTVIVYSVRKDSYHMFVIAGNVCVIIFREICTHYTLVEIFRFVHNQKLKGVTDKEDKCSMIIMYAYRT